MPVFAYKARDRGGALTSGVLTADTPASGRQTLRQDGLRLLEFEAVAFKEKKISLRRTRKAKRQEHVAEFARQLSMLLRAGVPLAEAIGVLAQQSRGKLTPVLRDLRDRVRSGSAFGDALRMHESWFDNVFCSAVEVGQTAGSMERSLAELATFIRERESVKTRVFSALAYPMVLAVVGSGVVLFLMSYVIPQLLSVLEASGSSLPTSTMVLKSISDCVTQHWAALALAGVLLIALATAFLRWPTGKRWYHAGQLRTPVIGTLIRKGVIAQFAQSMSLLLRSGVSFLEALRLVRSTTGHLLLADELGDMEQAIQRGSDIAPTLEGSRVFPPLVARIVNVGQNTGELTEMLTQLKEGYEMEVRLAIEKATSILEPVLIVVMSAAVGYVVFATMMPILEATRTIQ